MGRLVAALVAVVSVAACATQSAERASRDEVARYADELVRRTYRDGGPGAAILVARGDRIHFRGARGEADIQAHTPLRPDSVFRIGSITKQFTAAAILTLVDDGRIGLDDPLSRYLPGYPNGDRIMLRHLLNHTSGVRNFNALPGYWQGIERDLTTSEIIDLFRDQPADFPPGESWGYSNSGYVLLGAVVEAVTGLAWHEYMEQRFFRPLGMRNTGYGHDPRFAALQVAGYTDYEGSIAPMRPMSMTQAHAAGALVSTIDDMLIWTRALHEGRILRSETYAAMTTPEGPAARDDIRYGFGGFEGAIRGERFFQHSGRIFGFISSVTYLPDRDITVVLLENDDVHDGPDDEELARRLVGAALGEPYPWMTPVAVDAASLEALVGVYNFDGGVTRIFRLEHGRLTSQRDAGPRRTLTPIGVDDFLYEDGFNRLRIERAAGGAVIAVRFFAQGDGDGARGVRTSVSVPPILTGLALPRAALERLPGVYANDELTVSVTLIDDALMAQIEGQDALRLLASSPTQFNVEEAGASVEFRPSNGPVTEMIIRQNGRETTLVRTP
jgi:CubicO group peptidase (beta-lactamase class C family)